MLLPIAVAALATAAWLKATKPQPMMTPERRMIYQSALEFLKTPEQFDTLAAAFRKEGLTVEADMLEKRAKLLRASPDVKDARREVFRNAMKSTDPISIAKVADIFEKEGATGSAKALRAYAKTVIAAKSATDGVKPDAPAA
jgi:hypothetical protein